MTGDATDGLVRSLAETLPAPIDELHVAAILESRGVTDEAAREHYRHDDVFALARTVFQRLPGPPADTRAPVAGPRPSRWRTLAHGPLYILPSAVYPAVFAELGPVAMVRGLVFATALGWVWGMGMSLAAHRLLGEGRAAGRLLRRFVAAGLGVALAGAVALALTGPGGPLLVAFVLAQLGFQLACGVLIFDRGEVRVFVVMLPAFAAGVLHVVSGYAPAMVGVTLAMGASSSVLALAAAWRATTPAAEPPGAPPVRTAVVAALPGAWYAAMSALFLLSTDARFVTARFDLAIAVAPLACAMGAVEWRSHHFDARARELLHRARDAAEFLREVRRTLVRELTLCLLVVGGFALVLLAVLAASGVLTSRGALLIDAHVVLGGAYFLGFLLANYGRYRLLLGIATGVTAAQLLGAGLAAARFAPHGEVPIFLACSGILLALLLTALRDTVGRVHHYR
ncbi:hypothetical protein [Amycolatopsis anabasis]|uniref:hypothetical protein n=1 Tax=Amycolatopsis anabasis TaxID=1840409 RepID=UPI00131C4E94